MLQLQNVYVQVQLMMQENKLPRELIDLIFDIVNRYNFKQMTIERETYFKSVWWNSSYRIRGLCCERGALQIGHYETWALFPSFVLFSQVLYHQNFDIRVKLFDKESCGIEGYCSNCVKYGFPCRNKIFYCPMTDGINKWYDDTFLGRPNFEIEGIWDISDDPNIRK